MLAKYHYDHAPLEADIEYSPSAATRPGKLYGELVIRVHCGGLTLFRERKPVYGETEHDIERKARMWAKECCIMVRSKPSDFAE